PGVAGARPALRRLPLGRTGRGGVARRGQAHAAPLRVGGQREVAGPVSDGSAGGWPPGTAPSFSAARSLALSARGLAATSASSGVSGRRVSSRSRVGGAGSGGPATAGGGAGPPARGRR